MIGFSIYWQVVSDDEEDLTQMDMGRGGGKVPHRNDFANEEDWEQYVNPYILNPKQ